MRKLIEFVGVFFAYLRGGQSIRVAARTAYGCAFRGLPF